MLAAAAGTFARRPRRPMQRLATARLFGFYVAADPGDCRLSLAAFAVQVKKTVSRRGSVLRSQPS
jgi:hypothetical protein